MTPTLTPLLPVTSGIACPISQVRPKSATNSPFAFEKVFGVDEYMAAGILEIPVGGSKPTKPTKDNNYVSVPSMLQARLCLALTLAILLSLPDLCGSRGRRRRARSSNNVPYVTRRHVHGSKGQHVLH